MIKISARERAYAVNLSSIEKALSHLPESGLVITDENVARCYGSRFERFAAVEVVPAGESSKSLEVYGFLLGRLANRHATRSTSIIAVGGGVVGDLAGFVAATYMRGMPLLMVPTSLLAMVDSSVGGKVAVDLPHGKNLVGAFYPPEAVWICPEFLETLPEREFWNGMAEVIKTALILDAELAATLSGHPVEPRDARLPEIIERCIRHKASVVEEDEFETTGRRAVLNFGHTVGHAIEREQEYKGILHGEAVALGMIAEARIGEMLGVTPTGLSAVAMELVLKHKLPLVSPGGIRATDLIQSMRLDKKSTAEGIGMSLLTGVGTCKLVQNVSERSILQALHEIGFD